MNAKHLLAYYEHVADAPDAVSRMRRFVLDLAVRGKLVPQDPNDEPASELQARLAATYSTDKVGGGRRGKRPVIAAGLIEEPPYELPLNWVWVRMGGLGDTNIGLTYSPADVSDEGYPVLRSNNIQGGSLDLSSLVRVRTCPKDSVMVQQGDILICARNGSRALVGKAALIGELPEPMAFGAFMAIFRSPINRYLHLFISSPVFRQVIDEVNTTTINQITQANLRSTLVPLPPLPEQHRIVAKVDELMTLCDRLEAVRAEREATRDKLTAASLACLNAPSPESFRDDVRLALEALPALTARPDQIKRLRQTILNLAVRGKLVPQNPSDESASVLRKRIAAERASRVEQGILREQKPLPPIKDGEVEFELCDGWQWARMGEVIKLWNGFAFKSDDFQSDGIPVVRIGDLENGQVVLSHAVRVSETVANSVDPQFWIQPDALLIAMSGATTGKTAFNRTGRSALLNQRVGRLEVLLANTHFIRLFFETIVARNLSISFGTAIPNLSAKQINETVIALPPRAEQDRIVAKVDELMAICDCVEASLTSAEDTRRRLLNALLAESLAPVERELEAAE